MPRLNLDVTRIIVEMSAEEDRTMALKLVHVSRLIQQWVDKILYRNVTLEDPHQAERFLLALESGSDRSLNVKTLCFASQWDIHLDIAHKILSNCNGLVSLSCWVYLTFEINGTMSYDPGALADILFITPAPSPRRNSVVLQDPARLSFPFPQLESRFFCNVTHLIVRGSINVPLWQWQSFSLLPLSHFSIELDVVVYRRDPARLLHDVMNTIHRHSPKNLRVFLVYLLCFIPLSTPVEHCFDIPYVRRIIVGHHDPRVVVGITEPLLSGSRYQGLVVEKNEEDLLREWMGRGNDAADSWELAEQVQVLRTRRDMWWSL